MVTEPMPLRSEPGKPHPDASLDPPGGPERKPSETLVEEAVSLLEGVVDYLTTVFRLERYRFETRTRSFIQKLLVRASGAAVVLVGLVFISVGVSSLLSESIGASYAGPLIVGGIYVAAGLIAIFVVRRKGED